MVRIKKQILITLWHLDGLHGSCIYCLEIGKHFIKQGYDVSIAAVRINTPLRRYAETLGLKVFCANKLPVDVNYDIIWACHFPLLPYLILKGIKYVRIINSMMSNFALLESPLFFKENIDLYLVLEKQSPSLLRDELGFTDINVLQLPNTAPDEFFEKK